MDWQKLPSLSSLRAFTAVAEHLSYSAAGRALNVTPAAIMQQIRALEAHVGQSLVKRSGRGVALSRDGKVLANNLTAAFSQIQSGVENLRTASLSKHVQVTTSPAFAMKWLMPKLGAFHNQHPEVNLMLNPTGQVVSLDQAEIDLAIRYNFHTDLPEDADILLEVDLVVVANPSLLAGNPVERPSDLLHFPWLQELGTNEVSDWFRRHNATIDRPPMITHMPGNLIMDAVTRGDGVTYTVRQWIERELSSGELVELFADPRCGVFHIVPRERSPREPVASFIRWLQKQTG